MDWSNRLRGKYDHGESENLGDFTLGSILRALKPIDLKNGKNFKVIISRFLNKSYQIDHEESENLGPEIRGSILKAPGLKALKKN